MADDNNENAKRQVADSKRDYDYDCDNDDNDNNLQQQEQPKHTDKADDDYTKKLQSKLNNHNTSSSDITSVRSLNLLDERMTSKVAAHQQQQQQQDMMLQQKAMLNDSASQGSEKGQPWIVSSLVDTTGSHLKSVNDKGITTTTGAHDLPVKVGLDGMGGNSMYQNTGLETGYYSTDEEDNLAIAVPINENDDAEYNSDMFLPAAVEFDPDMKVSPETIAEIQKARKRFIIVFLSIFTLVMVSIGIGIYFGIQKHNRNKEKNQKDPYIHPRTQLGIYEMITSNTNDTDTILQDDMNHPYSKAYNWILYNDPAQLYPNASNFMQRYTLAYLYYATITNVDTTTSTTYNRHWLYCSPPADIDPTVAVNTSECQVTDFYMEREPVIDTNQNHWLSNNDTECEWAGIICDDFGNVREINIAAMGITGTFPSDAFKLFSFLDVIDVAGNQMYGELMPTTFTDMNHLLSVKASKNNFTGLVPTSLLQGRNIRTVTIPANQFTGMNVLNDFSKDLKSFSVTDNRLSGKIEINTDDINRLNSLSFIRLDGNSFTGTIPPELFQLHYLKYATMSNNALSGQVPSTVGLASLDQLTLSKNKLTGPLPDELYNCTLLGALELEGNQLNGTISPLIGNLHEFLLVMSLANNQFEGTVPTEFGLLTLLQTLTVRGNAFTEAIPSEMCVLRESFLDIVEADCLMENEIVEIQCPTGCCTTCCNPSGSECQAM